MSTYVRDFSKQNCSNSRSPVENKSSAQGKSSLEFGTKTLPSKIKYFAAEKIKQLSLKSGDYKSALIEIGQKISDKGLSAAAIEKEANKVLGRIKKDPNVLNNKVLSANGRHLFTWRNDNNNMPSLHFPKQIISLINDDKINFDELTKSFMEVVEDKISIIKK